MLEQLNLPSSLKKLSCEELEKLAGEIREKIINVVSKNGGHLSSNLGSVELAMALLTVYDSPSDKIIWDVGHQAYAHKILTGRGKNFDSLRQYEGVSGYPNPEESPHDVFMTGHAGTSISSALGLAKARDLNGQNHKIVAVIGDGSLSGGVSLEAVNNAMSLNSNLVVVLNDNEMSISKNVGSLSEYFTGIRMNPLYTGTKERVEEMVKRIPRIGVPLFHIAVKMKNRLKNFIIDFQTEVIVEELGFQYLGPIDGHNTTLLMSALSFAKEAKKPILLHVITKKGKGYAPAEKDPTKYHGAAPFFIESGEFRSVSQKSNSDVFGGTLVELAEADKKIVAVTAAMLDGTGLDEFAKKFPSRFFDVGIAEEHAVVFAGGLAKGGMKPVVAIYSTFLQRSYDQIFHDVCLQNLPVVFCLDRAGVVGDDGPTHNGVFDMAYLRHLPNMVLMAPKDENELRQMLYTALAHNGPIAIRYPRSKVV
ncbi:MAG: 1-deoxy-D-xylulose-5-phosphate synthase, partial [Candidatus Margulisiibacteriota bacterium]